MGAEGPSGTRTRFALAPLAVSSAAAVAVYIVARISLAAAVVALVVPAAVAWWWTWRRLPAAGRAELVRRCRAGVVAGIAATLAYDLTGGRWSRRSRCRSIPGSRSGCSGGCWSATTGPPR